MSDVPANPGRIVPAEQAAHLPTWSLSNFQDGASNVMRRRPLTEAEKHARSLRWDPEPAEAAVDDAEPLVARVDPAELEAIRRAAFDEGYAAGYDHGELAARQEAERLRALADACGAVFERFEDQLAPRLVELATEVARQVVRRELATDPALVVAVIRDAFGQMTGGESGRQLVLNPADAQLAKAHLGDELAIGPWKLVEDPQMSPGGCRIATHQSEIDATLATRWRRTVAALGTPRPLDAAVDDEADAADV